MNNYFYSEGALSDQVVLNEVNKKVLVNIHPGAPKSSEILYSDGKKILYVKVTPDPMVSDQVLKIIDVDACTSCW